MKPFIFISDFDSTITPKDFYWIIIDDYVGQKGIDYYTQWKKQHKIGTSFLNKVFTWHTFSDEEHIEALDKVSMDKDLESVVEWVESNHGEFHILSAGFRYYIDSALKKRGLGHLSVHTNDGTFRNNTFIMEPDRSSPFYSDVYGIDKEKVALHYKKQCDKLYFAGDSEPDFHAAKHADVVFAKEELARLMEEAGLAYISYENFNDIWRRLKAGV